MNLLCLGGMLYRGQATAFSAISSPLPPVPHENGVFGRVVLARLHITRPALSPVGHVFAVSLCLVWGSSSTLTLLTLYTSRGSSALGW
jgi:hypothetical protein